MITVTSTNGTQFYIAAHLISSVEPQHGQSLVSMNNGDEYEVREDAEYISSMIKFEMEKYHR